MTESKEKINASHAHVLEVINASSTNSDEFRAKLEESRSLVLPHMEIQSKLGALESTLSAKISEVSRISQENIQNCLRTMQTLQESFENHSLSVSAIPAMNRTCMQKHLSKDEKAQACVSKEQATLTGMIIEIKGLLKRLQPQEDMETKELIIGNEKLNASARHDFDKSHKVVLPKRDIPALRTETGGTVKIPWTDKATALQLS